MAVQGIGNLGQSLVVQSYEYGQTLNSRLGANTLRAGNAGNPALTEDIFTPSTQSNSGQATAQDAGIFQVSRGALNAVTANILFAHTTPDATLTGPNAEAASAIPTNASDARSAAATNSLPPVTPGQLFAAKRAGQAPAANAIPTPNEQGKIQALNAGLPALGLSKAEIQEIDSLATQIQNFNPAAYSNLVNQFEAKARQVTQQNAANPAPNPIIVGNSNTPASAKTNSDSFQG